MQSCMPEITEWPSLYVYLDLWIYKSTEVLSDAVSTATPPHRRAHTMKVDGQDLECGICQLNAEKSAEGSILWENEHWCARRARPPSRLPLGTPFCCARRRAAANAAQRGRPGQAQVPTLSAETEPRR